MADNADFSKVTDRVNEAQANIKATAGKNRAQLQAQVEQAQDSAKKGAGQARTKATQAKSDVAGGMQAVRDNWQAHVTGLHDKAADKKAEKDARKSEHKAEAAELYAEDAVGFAIAAIQEAEYAVLDAALTRYDADTAAGVSS
jgi:hypothetical protein